MLLATICMKDATIDSEAVADGGDVFAAPNRIVDSIDR